MAIVKFNLKGKRLDLVDGDLKEVHLKPRMLHFSLVHKGHSLFEAEFGKTVMAGLLDVIGRTTEKNIDTESISKLIGGDFIKSLASSSYIQLNDSGFKNDESTQLDFRDIPGVESLFSDIDFITELINMTVESLPKNREERRSSKGQSNKRNRNQQKKKMTPTPE